MDLQNLHIILLLHRSKLWTEWKRESLFMLFIGLDELDYIIAQSNKFCIYIKKSPHESPNTSDSWLNHASRKTHGGTWASYCSLVHFAETQSLPKLQDNRSVQSNLCMPNKKAGRWNKRRLNLQRIGYVTEKTRRKVDLSDAVVMSSRRLIKLQTLQVDTEKPLFSIFKEN